jgi:NDP-4-keto-2,6-dideoxyhexose 3-C-methyltransferase
MEHVKEEEFCRVCKGKLNIVLDLGSIFPSGFTDDSSKISEDQKVPLVLAKCDECGLVQLKHTVNLDLMYRQYWYSSSLNKSMVSSLREIVEEIESNVSLKEGDIVLDIGCNDGTMLEMYKQQGLVRVGFDPSLNLKRKEFPLFLFENDYFSAEAFTRGMGDTKGAKIITAIAMFYDLPDPNKFLSDVKSILTNDGIFVVQFTDLLSMFKLTAFDNICHEHLEYYKLSDIVRLANSNGFSVIDVSYNDVNGGSIRVTMCHGDTYPISANVTDSLAHETEFFSKNGWDDFKSNIDIIKFKVNGFLNWAKEHKRETHMLGSSTKGNSLLQLIGITNELIKYAAEVNPDKFGMKTVGSWIPIISEIESLIKHPDYYIVPIWHFKNNILKNEHILDYLKSGGILVFPLPDFHIVSMGFDEKITETRI